MTAYFVDKALGDDANTGLTGNPKRTWQSIQDIGLLTNDTVQFAAGTYISPAPDNIHLVFSFTSTASIDGSGNYVFPEGTLDISGGEWLPTAEGGIAHGITSGITG